jgi:DNA-directed RNA polymerase subunit RPC12/RpoP
MRKINCLRCGAAMRFVTSERIQLGETGLLFRDLSHILSGSLGVDIYACSKCKKLEFFSCEDDELDSELPQRTCPKCGDVHDFDYPKCPKCKNEY